MRALVSVVFVCGIVALLLVAGCTDILSKQKAGGFGQVSPSAGNGGGTGGGKGGSGSSTGSSLVPDDKYMKAYFTVDCTRILVDDKPSYTDTWKARLKGDAPFMVLRNWNREPAISAPQEFGSGPEGGEAKPNLHAEWIRTCKSTPCKPCHFVYKGPAGIGVSIQHDPKDAPADWKAMLTGTGTWTHDSVSDGTMDQYTTNQESACEVTDIHFMTASLYFQSDRCFDIQYSPATGYTKPFTFGDGSMITYTSSDPEASLDSTAVFHFSG